MTALQYKFLGLSASLLLLLLKCYYGI